MVERKYAMFRFGVHQNGACIVYLQTQAVLNVGSHLLIRRPYPDDNFNAIVAVNKLIAIFVSVTNAGYLVDDSMLHFCDVSNCAPSTFGLYRNSGH